MDQGDKMKVGDLVMHEMWGLAIVFKKVNPHVSRWWIRILDERCYKKDYTCWATDCEVISESR